MVRKRWDWVWGNSYYCLKAGGKVVEKFLRKRKIIDSERGFGTEILIIKGGGGMYVIPERSLYPEQFYHLPLFIKKKKKKKKKKE